MKKKKKISQVAILIKKIKNKVRHHQVMSTII